MICQIDRLIGYASHFCNDDVAKTGHRTNGHSGLGRIPAGDPAQAKGG